MIFIKKFTKYKREIRRIMISSRVIAINSMYK